MYKLITEDGQPLGILATVQTFRGETCILTDWQSPRHSGSTGRVYIQTLGSDFTREVYPGVIGAKFVYVPGSDHTRIESELAAIGGEGEA